MRSYLDLRGCFLADIGSLSSLKRKKQRPQGNSDLFGAFLRLFANTSMFWLSGEAHKRPKSGKTRALFLTPTLLGRWRMSGASNACNG